MDRKSAFNVYCALEIECVFFVYAVFGWCIEGSFIRYKTETPLNTELFALQN